MSLAFEELSDSYEKEIKLASISCYWKKKKMVRKDLSKKVIFEQGPEKGLGLIGLISGEVHSRQREVQRSWARESLMSLDNSREARVPGAERRPLWQRRDARRPAASASQELTRNADPCTTAQTYESETLGGLGEVRPSDLF